MHAVEHQEVHGKEHAVDQEVHKGVMKTPTISNEPIQIPKGDMQYSIEGGSSIKSDQSLDSYYLKPYQQSL